MTYKLHNSHDDSTLWIVSFGLNYESFYFFFFKRLRIHSRNSEFSSLFRIRVSVVRTVFPSVPCSDTVILLSGPYHLCVASYVSTV